MQHSRSIIPSICQIIQINTLFFRFGNSWNKCEWNNRDIYREWTRLIWIRCVAGCKSLLRLLWLRLEIGRCLCYRENQLHGLMQWAQRRKEWFWESMGAIAWIHRSRRRGFERSEGNHVWCSLSTDARVRWCKTLRLSWCLRVRISGFGVSLSWLRFGDLAGSIRARVGGAAPNCTVGLRFPWSIRRSRLCSVSFFRCDRLRVARSAISLMSSLSSRAHCLSTHFLLLLSFLTCCRDEMLLETCLRKIMMDRI